MAGVGTEWSERTRARYLRAWRVLQELEGADAFTAALSESSRPNGSINVSQLERCANRAVMEWVVQHAADA